jgi:hypothetical protein
MGYSKADGWQLNEFLPVIPGAGMGMIPFRKVFFKIYANDCILF